MNVSQDTSRVVLISLYLTCITVNDIYIPVWLSGSVTVWLSGRALRLLRKRLWVRFPGNTCTNENV